MKFGDMFESIKDGGKLIIIDVSCDGQDIVVILENGKKAIASARYIKDHYIALNKSKGYMVSIDGQNAPKQTHETLEKAEDEAHRLLSMPGNIGKKARVLRLEQTYQSSVLIMPVFEHV